MKLNITSMSSPRRRGSILITIFILTLTSCTVGPDYKRPAVEVPKQFKETKKNKTIWKVATPSDACNRGDWWKIFHDKELSQLENKLNQSNQTIATAAANFQQAQAVVDEARASYYPVLTSNASMIRQKGAGSTNITSTSNGGLPSGGTSSSGIVANKSSPIATNHNLSFNSSWQPDIWGLVRRTVEADEDAAQSSAALLALTRLSAQASLATFYFELRALDMDQKLLDDTVREYKKAFGRRIIIRSIGKWWPSALHCARGEVTP